MAKSYSTTVKTDIRGNASEGTLTSLKVLCTKLKKNSRNFNRDSKCEIEKIRDYSKYKLTCYHK